MSGWIERPAVERAAQTLTVNAAEPEMGAEVRAVGCDEARDTFGAAKEHEVFAEVAQPLDVFRIQLVGEADAVPAVRNREFDVRVQFDGLIE
jgi:hypothetical protein